MFVCSGGTGMKSRPASAPTLRLKFNITNYQHLPKTPSHPHGITSIAAANGLAIESLPTQHFLVLKRAISNVLSTSVAEATFGQVIAGIPLAEAALETHEYNSSPQHPLLHEHVHLSPEIISKARDLRATFDASLLKASCKVLRAYGTASPGSVAFNRSLIELVAVAIHQIAVQLFRMDTDLDLSAEKQLATWRPPSEGFIKRSYPQPFPPTLLRHPWYCYYDDYPDGVADGVGYWAEGRIFGGVVLFDRRNPETETDVDTTGINLHSDLRKVTYRIYRLLDAQKQELLHFLRSEDEQDSSDKCPLPFRGTAENRRRIDPEEPILETGIYRDPWERRPLSEDDQDLRLRDVISIIDYVSLGEWEESSMRAWNRKDAIEIGL